jgi:hypothetical protein
MSICRFSTDIPENGFRSDLYIYYTGEVCEYIAICIASRRTDRKLLKSIPNINECTPETFEELYQEYRREVTSKEYKDSFYDIEMKYSGKSFLYDDSGECIEFLEELEELGYRFPKYVYNILKEGLNRG